MRRGHVSDGTDGRATSGAPIATETIQIQDAPNGAWRTVNKVFVDRMPPEEMLGRKPG